MAENDVVIVTMPTHEEVRTIIELVYSYAQNV